MEQALHVGDIVRIKAPKGSKTTFMDEPKNSLGYIYELYPRDGEWGVSVITENGVDLGGFSHDEQVEFLVYVSTLDFRYIFQNTVKLRKDWDAGMFYAFLAEVEDLKTVY